ncbi:SMP-30/gluconolactonase/LRE family protein [Acidisphaera sp. L21]|uniref:SMP-30/gluconolactonase/LRE family protein n=1 Tax=Acidisphaera sp. L21 TaxID=1641851 RepID=UPI00131D5101|nr:SMP-30/gluconolactonase/LRE family protein [Acidisphaera sp. L21]
MIPPNNKGDHHPDLLRVDAPGNLLVALYNGSGATTVSPAGTLLKLVNVPSSHHTNLAVG